MNYIAATAYPQGMLLLAGILAQAAAALLQPCPAQGSCVVVVSSVEELVLAHDTKVAPGRTLRVLSGGRLLLRGGSTLDFAGSTVQVPADEHVFAGEGHVYGLASAYPEWFADPIEPHVYPATALAAAYAATMSSGTIRFNSGTYISPFPDLNSFDSPRNFAGAGRPVPDSETSPTRLLNGTVIAGEVRGRAALRAEHLGVDAGPFVSARYLHGVKGFGLALFGTREHPASGSMLRDLSVLTTGMKDQHSVIVQGQHELGIDGLWIWTLGGTHGLVVKSDHSTIHNLHCKGAMNDCLIVKSDYATDRAGYAADVYISDVDIRYLEKPGDTGGIVVDSRWDHVHDVTFRNIREEGLSYGFNVGGSWFYHPVRLAISGWQALHTYGPCISVAGAREFLVENFTCELSSSAQGFILDADAVHLKNGSIVADGAAGTVPADGILDVGTGTTFQSIHAEHLRGYLLRSSHPPSEEKLRASGLVSSEGRLLAAALPDPWRTRLLGWKSETKLALRIAWTTFVTRFPHPFAIVVFAVILTAALSRSVLLTILRLRKKTFA